MRSTLRPAFGALRMTGAACLLALLAACGGGGEGGPTPAISTANGLVVGRIGPTITAYEGIPYAAPPTGEQRFRAPGPAASWNHIRDASLPAQGCPQPETAFGAAGGSEDCLYLNLYVPNKPGPHPVMVWFHGGGFYFGSAGSYREASRLVSRDVIVVTVNYRLGALGFLAHPSLSAEQSGASGNYGLMDQQAALRWVRDNITAFGGNKDNVTIFGESAGGASVLAHMAAPASRTLFHKAIVMSGAYALATQDTLATSQTKGAAVVAAAAASAPPGSCTTQSAACLRSLPVDALVAAFTAQNPTGPVPSVDTVVLPTTVQAAFASGTAARVPFMQGTTRDEYRLFVGISELQRRKDIPGSDGVLTEAGYTAARAALVPAPLQAAAASAYTSASYGNSPSLALSALATDLIFACNGRNVARRVRDSGNGGNGVYAYEFRDRGAPSPLPQLSFNLGAAHSLELPYLFGMLDLKSAEREGLAQVMSTYWTNFARTGNPNGTGVPQWLPFTSTEVYQGLDVPPDGIGPITTFAAEHQCNGVWAALAF